MEDEIKRLSSQVKALQEENHYLKQLLEEAGFCMCANRKQLLWRSPGSLHGGFIPTFGVGWMFTASEV